MHGVLEKRPASRKDAGHFFGGKMLQYSKRLLIFAAIKQFNTLIIMKKNPFEIKKSPRELITAQALSLDDYVMHDLGANRPSCASNSRIIIDK